MDNQILRFSALYHNNREAVAKALTSMWCGEVNNESQRAYVKQIKEQMTELFAPEQAIPVVQCVNRYETTKHTKEEVEDLIGNLWKEFRILNLPELFLCFRVQLNRIQ